jgi:hypothetical protein
LRAIGKDGKEAFKPFLSFPFHLFFQVQSAQNKFLIRFNLISAMTRIQAVSSHRYDCPIPEQKMFKTGGPRNVHRVLQPGRI